MRRAMSTLVFARKERLHPGLLDLMVRGGAEAIEIFACERTLQLFRPAACARDCELVSQYGDSVSLDACADAW